jgi:predicted ATP-dependent endonuclease of OLD family
MKRMRCRKIMFEGYKRLADTECNVSPYLLAFVGQNESGKSSVLTGLEWLSEDGETPLPSLDRSRMKRKTSGWIVGAEFTLGDEEKELIKPLGFAQTPTGISLFKQANGSLNIIFDHPRKPKRDPLPFTEAAEALARAQQRLEKQISSAAAEHDEDEDDVSLESAITRVAGRLSDPEVEWEAADEVAARTLADWLDQPLPRGKNPRDAKTAALIRTAAQIGGRPHPNAAGLDLLRERIPAFLLFREDDRVLPTVTPIDVASRGRMSSATRNLLAIAELNIATVWDAHTDEDSGEKKTLLDASNRRLDAFFGEAWNQSNISVNLDVDERGLLTHVVDLDTRRFTRIEERSEGLRAFITLAAFLGSQALEVPPILLIDEAELHLHADAQADLVGGLLRQINASQVWYTTHSPACLPSDLGTGIRLLERHGEKSQIKSHFWTNQEPGFGPLLYAMGAGAAAFSRCRWAVLGEGASEMILLPTLIRNATGLDDLPYQVAPGLANARSHDMDLEEVAARVIYLTDGDKSGSDYLSDLRAANVPEARLKSLPPGTSVEDLLDRDFLISVINALLPDVDPRPTARTFRAAWTAGRSIKKWAEDKGVALGKVAIAYEIIDRGPDIQLAPGAAETLRDLHEQFMAAFEAGERSA